MGRKTAVLRALTRLGLIWFLMAAFTLIDNCSAAEKKRTPRVKKGDKVKVHYTGRLKDGTVFDKSQQDQPLEFTVGAGEVIAGFDKAIRGMKLNQNKKIKIKAKDAYGKRTTGLIRQFSRDSLPADFTPRKGIMIKLQDENGREGPGKIIDVTEKTIIVDANHPLAGKNLIFDTKVIAIEQR